MIASVYLLHIDYASDLEQHDLVAELGMYRTEGKDKQAKI
jgi:hypothetical protein